MVSPGRVLEKILAFDDGIFEIAIALELLYTDFETARLLKYTRIDSNPGSFDFGGRTMSYQIHEMTIKDYDDVLALWRASEGIELSSVDSKESILRFLERNPGLSFVIRDGKQLIGAVLCGHDGRRGYIDHLAVHKDYRRHGLGRSLVGRCLHALMRIGIRKHQLFILDDNKEAIEFWKNIGWAKQVELVTMSHLTGNNS